MDRQRDHRNLGAHGGASGEETAVDVVVGCGGNLIVVGRDELDAGIVKRQRGIAVVGEDDADGDKTMRDIGQAEEVTVSGFIAGLGRDGDVFAGMDFVRRRIGWQAEQGGPFCPCRSRRS